MNSLDWMMRGIFTQRRFFALSCILLILMATDSFSQDSELTQALALLESVELQFLNSGNMDSSTESLLNQRKTIEGMSDEAVRNYLLARVNLLLAYIHYTSGQEMKKQG